MFALTLFIKGPVHVCVCVCAFSCVYTHPKDKDGWKLPVLLCVTLMLLHSIFVRGSNSELRGLFCLNWGGGGEHVFLRGTSDQA